MTAATSIDRAPRDADVLTGTLPVVRTTAVPVPRGSRLVALDGLRFLAAAGVLLYHFIARETDAWGRDLAEVAPALAPTATYLSLGPELFFVISGFVILMTAWGRSVPDIIGSRVGRLYPGYWVGVLATGFLLLVIWPGKEITGGQMLVNLTLLQSLVDVGHVDGVYWTLWVELRFYLLIVLFAAVGITRRRVLAFAALWPLAAMTARVLGWSDAVTWLVAPYAPLFAAGMALYVIHRCGHTWAPWLIVAGNAVLVLAALVPARMDSLGRNSVHAPTSWGLAMALLGCIAVVAIVALTPVNRWTWSGLTTAGALTYPLYLLHEYWGLWVIHLLHDRVPVWAVLLAATALSLLLAWLVHRFVERPLGPRLRRATTRFCERVRDGGRLAWRNGRRWISGTGLAH
ncbi:acyltransferase [Cellulomonas sp. NPDC089187]|uniref:acyltransferase family protein n=1 Tax=Cellulomonas sp. NPDC089187 TaxID=3154970 RepID=UPI003424BED9